MVSAEHRTGLYVSIPVYFALLGCCAFWAHRRMDRMEHEGRSDKMSAHYLGGRQFGRLMTAGTIFASLFSGYTVVGVPNEAFNTGWMALRWMPTVAGIAVAYIGTGIRLRKASFVRNHQSPCDFVTDRFQSQLLRYTIVFLQVLPTLIYLSAQVAAIKNTFNSMFGLDPDEVYPVVVIMVIILLFEWAGGLSSVALTDSIQGLVMVLSFIMLPLVIKRNFGGWSDLNPQTYPEPQFYQTPTKEQQWEFWQFSLVNISFFTLPHLLQRTYAARSLESLKWGYYAMSIGPWFTLFVSVFMGTVGVQMLAGEETPSSPFTAILEKVMDVGGFAKGVGVIAFTASLAAIMSTADSLIIAISQLVIAEMVYPLKPNASPRMMANFGRLASLLAAAVALIIGLMWKEGITALGNIQFPLSLQAVPTFLVGLYGSKKTDVHPWSLVFGAITSTIYVFVIYFAYLGNIDNPIAIDAGVTGFVIHIIVTILLEIVRRIAVAMRTRSSIHSTVLDQTGENSQTPSTRILLFPHRPKWDVPHLDRFGEKTLSPGLLRNMMNGTSEPFKNAWYAFLLFFAITIITPLVPEGFPPLDAGNNFIVSPAIVRGLPWWAFKVTILCIVPYVIILVTIFLMPNSYPADEKKIEKEGIDPDIIELTPKEMGRRISYDETNRIASKGRNTLCDRTSQLSMTVEVDKVGVVHVVDTYDLEARRRISSIALGKVEPSILEADPTDEGHPPTKDA